MTSEVLDVSFTLTVSSPSGSRTLPADHGYALYAAVCRVLPWVHASPALGIHSIAGTPVGNRQVSLRRRPVLSLRVPVDLIPKLCSLAGAVLDVEGTVLHVGVPTLRTLRPAPRLRSRLVVIKGKLAPDAFLDAVRAQLHALGVAGEPRLLPRPRSAPVEPGGLGGRDPWLRRTLRVRDRIIVGYALEVGGLSPSDAIRLQAAGLGGRRRFGCGIFLPVTGSRM